MNSTQIYEKTNELSYNLTYSNYLKNVIQCDTFMWNVQYISVLYILLLFIARSLCKEKKICVLKHIIYDSRVVQKTRFWGNQLFFHFLNLYVEKKTPAKAVACTMIFNTASTMTNLSLNSQNRIFSCSGIGRRYIFFEWLIIINNCFIQIINRTRKLAIS